MSAEEFNAEEEIRMIKEQLRAMRVGSPRAYQPYPAPGYPGQGYGGYPLPPDNSQLMELFHIATALSKKVPALPNNYLKLFAPLPEDVQVAVNVLTERLCEHAVPGWYTPPITSLLQVITGMVIQLPDAATARPQRATGKSGQWPKHIEVMFRGIKKLVNDRGLPPGAGAVVDDIMLNYPDTNIGKAIADFSTDDAFFCIAFHVIDAAVTGYGRFIAIDRDRISFDAATSQEAEAAIIKELSVDLAAKLVAD